MLFDSNDQSRAVAIWQRHISPALGNKAFRQFKRATLKPPNWFVEEVVAPKLYRPDEFGAIYYPVDITARSVGRNHHLAEAIATDDAALRDFGNRSLLGLTYFANPLRTDVEAFSESDVASEAPKERVVLGDHYVFTFEFDVPEPTFLEEQLSWLRSSKNVLDCPMGDVFRHCSGFAEFAGITVCYSGNKSLHIHIVFTTALALARLRLDRVCVGDLRAGLVEHWCRLAKDVQRILDVSHEPDASLRFPEAFRRLPNGVREIGDNHILGIPAGTLVPQITLWEKSRERAGGDDLPMFFTPEPFQGAVVGSTVRRASKQTFTAARKLGPNLTPAEVSYCEERLREWFPGFPRLDHLTFEGGRWVAKFRNSEGDRTPSSVMREDYQTVHIVGRDAQGLSAQPLPFPLGFMLRLWCGQLADQEGREQDVVSFDEIINEPQPERPPTTIEERFRAQVVDAKSAGNMMRRFFRATVPLHDLLVVVGPEGVGKTSVLMERHHLTAAFLTALRESPIAMYAFADYAAAEAKCEDFNRVQSHRRFRGVILPSFSRAYEDACKELGIMAISLEEAARRKFQSRWEAIKKLQPKIMECFRRRHAAMYAEIGNATPVFFTVHAVAHEWRKHGQTRVMWAPSFWYEFLPQGEEGRQKLRRETKLGLLVHDEIKAESLIEMQPEAVLRWIEMLVASAPKVWRKDSVPLPEALTSYEAYVARSGMPVVDRRPVAISFDEARRLAGLGSAGWDHVVTSDSGEYGCRTRAANDNSGDEETADPYQDRYGCRHGRDWRIMSRGWWNGVATNVVLLTTEAVPTAVARAADSGFAIYELETPRIQRDVVDVHAHRSVRGDNLATRCAEFREARPTQSFAIISNRVAMLEDTITHMAARGSNALIGRNILQTMTFMTPDEYEQMQALNAWTGRRDLVGLRHVDEFNQSAGRNLGFRRRGNVEHHLLVNRRLFELLATSSAQVLGRARYEMRLHVDRQDRYEIKRAG